MLYPQANQFRMATRFPDFWEFRLDPEDAGLADGWSAGFDGGRPIAVPASWNDLFEDGRDVLGPAWYQVAFRSGGGRPGWEQVIRFDSVSYQADVWLNGDPVGGHRGAHLPFECPIDAGLREGENRLVVRVDGRLDRTTVPGGPQAKPGGTGTR
ncbi:MAG: sugar-binding domain-containing protein, partial [Acidimicrobiales bacterium]